MDENLHNIDKIFRDSLEGHEEVPSQQVWNAIDSNLDKNKIKQINRKYTRLKRAAFLLLLLLLCITIYDLGIKHPGDKVAKGNNNSNANKKDVPENNPSTSQNSVPKNNNDNFSGKTIQETKKISAQNKIQPQKGSVTDNSITKTSDVITTEISKKNMTGVTNTDKNTIKNENSVRSGKTRIGFNIQQSLKTNLNKKKEKDLVGNLLDTKEKTNKPAIIIPLSMVNTEKPVLQSLQSAKKIILPVSLNNVAKSGKSGPLKQSRFSLTIFLSPDFPFYRLQKNPPDNQLVNNIKEAEKPDLSTTTGIWIDYKLNDHWSLQSGASYSNAIILIDPKTIYAEQDNNTGDVKYRFNASSGYGYLLPSFANSPTIGDSLYAFTSTHTLRYLNIPLGVKYGLQKGKFNFFASAGMSSNILLEGIIETVVENNSYNESEVLNRLHGLKKIYFSGLVSIGAEYKLNSKFSLMISSIGRFALNSINNKDAPVKSYPNSFGLSAGIRMNF